MDPLQDIQRRRLFGPASIPRRSAVVDQLNRLASQFLLLHLQDALPRLERSTQELPSEGEASPGMAPELARAILAFSNPDSAPLSQGPAISTPPLAASDLEARISQLYEDLRQLVARLPEDPTVRGEIDRKRQELHVLQVTEADQARLRAEARLPFTPAEGTETLARLRSYLEGEAALLHDPGEQVLSLVREALEDLEPRHRRFLILDLVEAASPEEIQRRLDISPRSLSSLRVSALVELRDRIKARLG